MGNTQSVSRFYLFTHTQSEVFSIRKEHFIATLASQQALMAIVVIHGLPITFCYTFS